MVVVFVTCAREEGDTLIVRISLRGFLLGSGPGLGLERGGVAGLGVLLAGIFTVGTGVPATNRGSIGTVNAKEESPSICNAERATGGAATAGTVSLGEAFAGAGTAIASAANSGAGTASAGAGTASAGAVSSGVGTAIAGAAIVAGTAIAAGTAIVNAVGAADAMGSGVAVAVSAGAAITAAAASAEAADGTVLLPWKFPNVPSHAVLADVTAVKGEKRGNPTGSPRTDMTRLPRDRAPMA